MSFHLPQTYSFCSSCLRKQEQKKREANTSLTLTLDPGAVSAVAVLAGGSASAPASGQAGAPLEVATSPVSPELPPLSLANLERHQLVNRGLYLEEDIKRARSGQPVAERLPRPGRPIASVWDRLWGELYDVEGRHQFYPSPMLKAWAADNAAIFLSGETKNRSFSPIVSQKGSDAPCPTGTKRPSVSLFFLHIAFFCR
jgi:hypothetical protein